jgi:serine/threonine-protein kinase HipA
MFIQGQDRRSQIAVCLKAAPLFSLSEIDALDIAVKQIRTREQWSDVCQEAQLSQVDRHLLWRRQLLHPIAFVEAPEAIINLVE